MLTTQINLLRNKLKIFPLGHVVDTFLDYLTVEAGLSPNTVLAYGRDLLKFVEYCHSENINKLSDVIPTTAYSFLHHLAEQGLAENSISRNLVAVKMLIRFGVLTGKTTEDITDSLESPKLWKRLRSNTSFSV